MHVDFNTCDNNLLFVIYNQARKYKRVILFKVIDIADFNISLAILYLIRYQHINSLHIVHIRKIHLYYNMIVKAR